jgi:translation initiation factor RLI1
VGDLRDRWPYSQATARVCLTYAVLLALRASATTEPLRRRSGSAFKMQGIQQRASQRHAACTQPTIGDWRQGKGDSKFVLRVKKGSFSDSEIVVLLGQNGTGGTHAHGMAATAAFGYTVLRCDLAAARL